MVEPVTLVMEGITDKQTTNIVMLGSKIPPSLARNNSRPVVKPTTVKQLSAAVKAQLFDDHVAGWPGNVAPGMQPGSPYV